MNEVRLWTAAALLGSAALVYVLVPSDLSRTAPAVGPPSVNDSAAFSTERLGLAAEADIEPITGHGARYDVTRWPAASRRVNDAFGPRLLASDGDRYDFHRGIDIAPLVDGTSDPVTALADGAVFRVYHAGDPGNPYDGNTVVLRHAADSDIPIPGGGVLNGAHTTRVYYSLYQHLSQIQVVQGEPIALGAVLGQMGAPASGYVHLHLEVRVGTTCSIESSCSKGYDPHVNPFLFLDYANRESLAAGVTSISGEPLRVHVSSAADELDFNQILVRAGGSVDVFDMNDRKGMDPWRIDDDVYASIRKIPYDFGRHATEYAIDIEFGARSTWDEIEVVDVWGAGLRLRAPAH